MAVMGVAWLVGIEFVARKQHEIDPALDRRINHAIVRLRNRARKPVSPFRRKITQAAKRRTQMDVARMNECNTVGHTPSLAQQTKKCRGVQTSSAKTRWATIPNRKEPFQPKAAFAPKVSEQGFRRVRFGRCRGEAYFGTRVAALARSVPPEACAASSRYAVRRTA